MHARPSGATGVGPGRWGALPHCPRVVWPDGTARGSELRPDCGLTPVTVHVVRYEELAVYTPLRLVAPKNGGAVADAPLETGGAPGGEQGGLVEIGGFEPPASALRTPRSTN